MPDSLFVYGTLKPGEPMDHLLESIGGTWKKGTVRGRFIWADEIPGFPYPGVILDDGYDTVDGYLFRSENLSNHWDDLDRYEGNSYKRVITQVALRDGTVTDAYIYELKTG